MAEVNKEVIYTVKLNDTEARWLKEYLSVPAEGEPEADKAMRMNLFRALSHASSHIHRSQTETG